MLSYYTSRYGRQTTDELVAAVSNAGGLGILGAIRMEPDQLLSTIKKIKKSTIKPYGVNLWLGPPESNNIQDRTSVHQQFLDNKFRKPLDIPLKSLLEEENNNQKILLAIYHLHPNCPINYK